MLSQCLWLYLPYVFRKLLELMAFQLKYLLLWQDLSLFSLTSVLSHPQFLFNGNRLFSHTCFKRKQCTSLTYFHLISVLPVLSKVMEQVLHNHTLWSIIYCLSINLDFVLATQLRMYYCMSQINGWGLLMKVNILIPSFLLHWQNIVDFIQLFRF